MIDPQTPQSSVDGIVSPSPEVTAPTAPQANPLIVPKKKKSPLSTGMIMVGAVAFAYIVPGLFIMAILPQPDGSLGELKKLATLAYVAGGALWLLLGVGSDVNKYPKLEKQFRLRLPYKQRPPAT